MGKLDDFIKSNPSIRESQLLSTEELILLEGGACSEGCRPACAAQCKPGCPAETKATIGSGVIEGMGSALNEAICKFTSK